jgi:TonB family protein
MSKSTGLCVASLSLVLALSTNAIAAETTKQGQRNTCVLAKWDFETPDDVVPPKLIDPPGSITAPGAELDKWLAEYRKIYGADMQIVFGMGTVTKKGELEDVEVLCAEPSGINDAAFKSAVSSWRFEPARKRKRPVDFPNYPILVDFTPFVLDPKTCKEKALPPMPGGGIRVAAKIVYADDIQRIEGEGPHYPQAALDADEEGVVIVRFGLSESGHVQSPSVVCATKPGTFDEAVLSSLRTWRYALPDGKAIQRVQLEITFEIPEEEVVDDEP